MSKARSLDQFIRKCEPEPAASCEACGESFTCGAGTGTCWCGEIKLSDAVRAELRTRYERCLCRACLEKLAVDSSTGMAASGQGDSELGTSR
ncbi:MAG TPA: cysteine-rich CWC family protein [Pyrinomonadaceae bacterium]|nr:cysteine-rich CWC family protein [Pyrinomonadaceae bacterium]